MQELLHDIAHHAQRVKRQAGLQFPPDCGGKAARTNFDVLKVPSAKIIPSCRLG